MIVELLKTKRIWGDSPGAAKYLAEAFPKKYFIRLDKQDSQNVLNFFERIEKGNSVQFNLLESFYVG